MIKIHHILRYHFITTILTDSLKSAISSDEWPQNSQNFSEIIRSKITDLQFVKALQQNPDTFDQHIQQA